jgi:hypothetical protein
LIQSGLSCGSSYPIIAEDLQFILRTFLPELKALIMTLEGFIQLDRIEQMEAFWGGVFVGELCDGEFKILCHQIEDFYVVYKILGGHYLDSYVFKDPNLLEPYLNQVDISHFKGAGL